MKRFLLNFIALLFVCFYGMSFVAMNTKTVEASNASRHSIYPVSTVHQNILSYLNENNEDLIFEMDVDGFASDVTVLKKKTSRVRISKCNKSSSLMIDKKSVLKATPFKSDIAFCSIHFKDGALNKMAGNDISHLSITAMESIHQTSLITLQSFLL